MYGKAWVPLRILIDPEDDSLEALSIEAREDVLSALRTYAATGKGGKVAYLPPGAVETDVIHAGRYEIDVRIDRSHVGEASLIFGGLALSANEHDEDD